MKTIKTHNKELIVVEAPEHAYDFDIVMKERMYVVFRTDNKVQEINTRESTLKKYKILGKLSELSEEVCARFVEKGNSGICFRKFEHYGFKHYTEKTATAITAKGSLISLLQSHGVDTSNLNTLLLIEKI